MKSKYTTLLLAAWLLGSATSCQDDFTDLEPQGTITNANFWKSDADALAASNGLYTYMKDDDMFGRGFFWLINASDDMVTGRVRATAANVRNFTATGNEGDTNKMYGYSYRVIRRCNEILKNVPAMNISESLKNRVLGEAYFMRAFTYFHIATRYGDQRAGVPIVTVANMDQNIFPRPASVVENYQLMEEDFKKAAELLPLVTTYAPADLGRAHKDAALAYLTKTYAFWAQYDKSKWAEAEKAADAVASSGSGRALLNTGNAQQDFHSVFTIPNNWSTEYIWSVVSGKQDGSILPGVLLENKGWGLYNGWGYFQPTLDLYEEYEANDPRRKATILTFGDEFQYLGATKRYSSTNSLTGFQFSKYMQPYETPVTDHLNANGDKPTTDLNVPLMRYAEVLLLKAEAQIMQGKNGDAALNAVRRRAGLAPKTGATLADLKHERRVELAGEFADRHADLVRWGDAQATYAKPQRGRDYADKSNPSSTFKVVEVWPARTFNPAIHHVWPIPPTDLANSKIAQNQGW
ncbi:RagB/SusD family nutrient uptake outer membrane protein [Hymenobacter crusticola]|uniref:RagB/SusD family nutrient uptake outer membrane protein n=1 Tax=Hymenobacter crusticola TaxID=1770526 RepID=A0A243WGH8_9BACT|nr:RagB/SusD family nutrient uptake outer membrane protein [Hymenobacter crusticola]OUJ74840.1 RagB/SusD family nutrient uptake outer membrane protein [Hymenobacter crusticola]